MEHLCRECHYSSSTAQNLQMTQLKQKMSWLCDEGLSFQISHKKWQLEQLFRAYYESLNLDTNNMHSMKENKSRGYL